MATAPSQAEAENDVEEPDEDVASEVLLKMHNLKRDDIEAEAWALYESRDRDLLTLERIARVVSVNKLMESHGLPTLSFSESKQQRTLVTRAKVPVPVIEGDPPTQEQQQLAFDMGLTHEEHLSVHGTFAEFMGLPIKKRVAVRMRSVWKTKQGHVMNASGDLGLCRNFITRKLKKFAIIERSRAVKHAEREELDAVCKANASAHQLSAQ